MTRPALLKLILILYIFVGSIISLWAKSTWDNTHVLGAFMVEGISTTSNLSQPLKPKILLNPYPTLSFNKELIAAKEFVLYDPKSGQVIAQSDYMKPVPIASTTKLMTTHLVDKILKLSDIVRISEAAGHQDPTGSLMGVATGEKLTVKSLLYGSLLVSGNDAVFALAEQAGGVLLNNPQASTQSKIKRFVKEMNKEADRLGMTDTHYLDPAGFNDFGRSSAIDLAKIMSIDIQQPDLLQIMSTSQITVYDTSLSIPFILHNSDRLLSDQPYPGIIAGKTGYTDLAGHCLVIADKQNGHTLISVILNTDQDNVDASANVSRSLLNIGFNQTNWE